MIDFKVQKRELIGKKNRQLRRRGIVPGAISRHKKPTINVQVKENNLLQIKRLDHIEIVNVEIEGEKAPIKTVVTEVIVNPINNKIESFLLTEIIPESHVIVRVPIRPIGLSPAVKNNIGVLVFSFHYVRLVVNSENIVPFIEIDTSKLEQVGQRVLVEDIELPEGVSLASAKDADLTILTIRPPQKALKEVVRTTEGAEGEEGETSEGETSEGTEATESASSKEE